MHKLALTAAYISIMAASTFGPIRSTTYPLAGIVVSVDRPSDTVTFETAGGMLYSITECEDWEPGDLIACTMDDNGTPEDVTDDAIAEYRYSGYVF